MLDLLIVLSSILLVLSGIKNLHHPAAIIKRKLQKKTRPTTPKLMRHSVLCTRIKGLVELILALFILLSLRFSIGWQEKPQVSMLIGDGTCNLPYDRIINSFVKDKNIPGMVVGIIDHNNTILYGYGYQDYTLLKKGRPVTAQTLFEIGSITKVFTGLMLAEAVQSGKLALQKPVAELLEAQTQKRVLLDPEITLERLATHTSGLPSIPLTLPVLINLSTLGITRGNPYQTISEQVMLDYLANVQKISTTERIFRYSNYGFGLLGMIIANNYGMTYEDTMCQTITSRMGMGNTLVHADKIEKKQMATGHHSFIRLGRLNIGRQSQFWDMHDAMAGCGGIRSSGEDLLKFLTGLIKQELPFSVSAQQPLFSINDQLAIGLAWLLQDNIVPNHRVIWHNGQTGGFNSYLGLIENERKGVFILSSLATTDVQPLGEELLRHMSSQPYQ